MEYVQKSNFFLFDCFTETILEKIVFDIVERKKWFAVEKNRSFKKDKNMDIFERGKSMDFVEK